MNKNISIGIITYWWSKENYGQLLQMYALQKYLRTHGYNAFLIKYDPRKDTTLIKKRSKFLYIKKLLNPIVIKRFLKQINTIQKREDERIKYPRFFNEFLIKHIKETSRTYNSITELRKDPPKADVYITGSDVVWSIFRPAYYLDFGPTETKRIAYAPSFGRETISDEECQQIKPLLKKFSLVTVRELEGLEICYRAGRQDAKLALDPTFLLAKNDYLKIAENFNIKEEFCFLYMIGSETKFSMREIFMIIKSRKMDVIYSTCEKFDKYPKTYLTIEQWIGYNSKASKIITNSYHGCIFAIIFNKDFIFLPLSGIYSKLNVRVQSLLTKLELSNRICNNNLSELFDISIDYVKVNKKLNSMINDSKALLYNQLLIK